MRLERRAMRWTPEETALGIATGVMNKFGILRNETWDKPPPPLWVVALSDRMFAEHADSLGVSPGLLRKPLGGRGGSMSGVAVARRRIAVEVYKMTGSLTIAAAILSSGAETVSKWVGKVGEL